MDAGIGIGGMNVEREEFVDSKFDLFGKTEYEVGVKPEDYEVQERPSLNSP